MTERWEQRLRALQVDTPPDMWRRVQEGPRNEPPIGLPPRRQRTMAATVALAVFVAAVVFAWQGLRPTTTPGGSSSLTPPPGMAVYNDPLGWTAFYPSDWSVTPRPQTSDGLGAGVTIENHGADAQGRVDDVVVLTVTHPLGATPDPSAGSSSFPLSANDFKVSTGPSNASLLQFRIDGVPYLATLRVGSSAPSADETAMDEVIASIRPTIAAPSVPPGPGTETTASANGIQVTYPSDWFMHNGKDLALVSPSVAFVIGSWDFPIGGDCAPSAAVRSIPRDGVLLWLIEYVIPDQPSDFQQRPTHFDLGTLKGPFECVGESAYVVLFRESGRFFQAQVVLGPDAGPAGKRAAEQVLDSMVVSRSA